LTGRRKAADAVAGPRSGATASWQRRDWLHDRRSMGGMVGVVVKSSLSLGGIVGDMAATGRGDRPWTRKQQRTVHQGKREAADRPACDGCVLRAHKQDGRQKTWGLVVGASREGGAEI
jgi:hypothetical protein